ncbi:MAG: PrsW family glutamic-type intramembrane protease [Thermoanaerobaculia bacterium]|nr:PrsW family glutamic-type intramembrane protease [Thermoanaerobaculia bacterium]
MLLYLLVGLLPVLCFLGALVLLDSYRLIRFRTVLLLLLAGAVVAVASLFVNRWALHTWELETRILSRYVAPVVEELLKGAIAVTLIWRRRVGFLVDAAIAGFAIGAGFATVENLHFLTVLDGPGLAVWMVRGFGTAIMHGGVTASLAILTKALADQAGEIAPGVLLPGWILAVVLHSAFNHFILAPDLSTLILLVAFPLIFFQVFRISEERTREWLGTGFDTDAELLKMIQSGRVSESPVGRYLESLKTHFEPTVVADMLCLLRLRLELSIRAKGILILQKAGGRPPPDPEVEEKFRELEYLEETIGKTGLAALHPILHFSDRDLWQYHLLATR